MAYKRVAFLQPDVVFDSSGLASLVEVNTNGYMIGNLHKAPSSLPHPPPLPARPAVPAQLRDSRAASGCSSSRLVMCLASLAGLFLVARRAARNYAAHGR